MGTIPPAAGLESELAQLRLEVQDRPPWRDVVPRTEVTEAPTRQARERREVAHRAVEGKVPAHELSLFFDQPLSNTSCRRSAFPNFSALASKARIPGRTLGGNEGQDQSGEAGALNRLESCDAVHLPASVRPL